VSSLSAQINESPELPAFARLIPGEITAIQDGARKSPFLRNSVREERTAVAKMPRIAAREDKFSFLLPPPMRGPHAWKWLRVVSVDLALVTLNWLVIGGLLVALRSLFPYERLLPRAAGEPLFLLGTGMLQGALITLIGYSGGLYTSHGEAAQQGRTLANSILWSTALLAFALQGNPAARVVMFLAAGALNLATLLAWRRAFWQPPRPNTLPENARNVLIVGADTAGRRIASCIRTSAHTDRIFCGFLDDGMGEGDGVLGGIGDLASVARRAFIDEVILTTPLDRGLARQVLNEARRLRLDVEIVPELFGCKPADAVIERMGDVPLISVHAERLPAATLACKRLFDIVAAGFALVILLPLLMVIAVSIKLDSRGPVLYRAQRAGRKGMPFPCFKFRTMVSDADARKKLLRESNQRSGPFFKIADDPRITRAGRLLRRYSLDELPQLWNVLRGEMSLVGPRPHPLDDFAGYETEHLARLDMTPGITGLWQVTARRDPSFQRGMELDREYIRRWSLALDLQILLKTIFTVMQGEGQ
jgi:exopolysaccharide biosynthesis polyprenyl glycosylphosphotransferase